jgi:DNA-directed RNA polymerase subunit RPC12/RpoP
MEDHLLQEKSIVGQDDFIEWPSYGVCPKCKRKVELSKEDLMNKLDKTELTPVLKRIPKKKTKAITYNCPYCGAEMKYIPPSHGPHML